MFLSKGDLSFLRIIDDLGERIVGSLSLDFLKRFKEFHEAYQVNPLLNDFFSSMHSFSNAYLCIVKKLGDCGKIPSIIIGF